MKIISIIGVLGCASGALAAETANPGAAPPAGVARETGMQRLAPAGQTVIENLAAYEVIDPLFEAVRIVLAQRGEVYPASYIQGISGSAFRIAGICPCAPTCSNAMWPETLARLLGHEARTISIDDLKIPVAEYQEFAKLVKNDQLPDPATLTPAHKRIYDKAVEMIETVKDEVAAGRAVMVWHAFTNAEYDIVCGYDTQSREFIGRSSYKGDKGPYTRAGEGRTFTSTFIGGWPSILVIGEKKAELNRSWADTAAIAEAVRHARDQNNVDKLGGEKWVMLEGIAAYDRWAKDFEKPDHKRGTGDAYCFGIYSQTHASAPAYLRGIAAGYPQAQTYLNAAADAFEREATTLSRGRQLLWWSSPEGPAATRNAAASKLLREACESYKAGIEQLEKALPLMQARAQ